MPRRSRPSTATICSQSGQREAGAPPRTSRRRDGGRLVRVPESGERGLVHGAGALRAAEDEQRRPLRREPEPAPALFPADALDARHRPPDDPVLLARSPRDRIGEEDALRKRRCEPVGEPEVRVRLRQRGRNAVAPGRVHHRAGDVSAAAEHDVGPPPLDDPPAGTRGARGEQERARHRRAGLPRDARDPERVELVAGRRDEAGLSPIGRPGERHAHVRAAATRRLSPVPVSYAPLSRRLRSDTRAARSASRSRPMLRRMPTAASATTRLEPP